MSSAVISLDSAEVDGDALCVLLSVTSLTTGTDVVASLAFGAVSTDAAHEVTSKTALRPRTSGILEFI